MSFNSLVFLVYLVIVLFLYYILPHKIRWVMLLIASYIFYAYWNFNLIFLIVASTFTAYIAGLVIEKTNNQIIKNISLGITLAVSLGMLLFFKYFNFFSGSVTSLLRLFGLPVDDFFLDLILPVGISFYTFQMLSYVIDVYRGSIEAEKHLGYFALFVSFFPQLVAGPIERPQDLIPQLKAKHTPKIENLSEGFNMLTAGFVKKVVIADTLAVYVNNVYNASDFGTVTGLGVLISTLIFIVQIFCDFSGYADIATGCAKMMGIELTVNFKHPLFSESLDDFWSNWHITLNSWFRDYIYIPLNFRAMGKKHMKARLYFNLFIVFFVSGLWHGANWTFVIWGIYNGVCSVIGSAMKKPAMDIYEKFGWKYHSEKTRWLRVLRTNGVLFFGLILFRSNNVGNSLIFFEKLFTDWTVTADYVQNTFSLMGMDLLGGVTAIFLSVLAFLVDHYIMEKRGKLPLGNEKSIAGKSVYVYMIWMIAIAWALLISQGLQAGFIYFQF